MTLCDAISLWPTPQTDSFRSRGGDRRNEKGLDRMARDWPSSGSGMWMTPTARDHKDGATSLANTPVNGLLGRQVLTIPPAGGDTSNSPELEPSLRRGADGLARRVDRLRVCGNGVVPLVAAHVLRTLAAELAGR